MTLKELKDLVNKYHNLKELQKEIFSNRDLSANQQEKEWEPLKIQFETTKKTIESYKSIFQVSAKEFENQLKTIFSEQMKVYAGYTNLVTAYEETPIVSGENDFFGPSTHYSYSISATLEINSKNLVAHWLLYKFNTFSHSSLLGINIIMNHYYINLWELILSNPKFYNCELTDYNKLIEACWKTIEQKLQPIVNAKRKDAEERKSLIKKKLEILKDEAKRRYTIGSLETDLEDLEEESKYLSAKTVDIDNYQTKN